MVQNFYGLCCANNSLCRVNKCFKVYWEYIWAWEWNIFLLIKREKNTLFTVAIISKWATLLRHDNPIINFSKKVVFCFCEFWRTCRTSELCDYFWQLCQLCDGKSRWSVTFAALGALTTLSVTTHHGSGTFLFGSNHPRTENVFIFHFYIWQQKCISA